jgi:hypothetical protein
METFMHVAYFSADVSPPYVPIQYGKSPTEIMQFEKFKFGAQIELPFKSREYVGGGILAGEGAVGGMELKAVGAIGVTRQPGQRGGRVGS